MTKESRQVRRQRLEALKETVGTLAEKLEPKELAAENGPSLRGDRLRKTREDLGLSLEDLAKLVRKELDSMLFSDEPPYSESYFGFLLAETKKSMTEAENGVKGPQFKSMQAAALSSVLGVSMEWLYGISDVVAEQQSPGEN